MNQLKSLIILLIICLLSIGCDDNKSLPDTETTKCEDSGGYCSNKTDACTSNYFAWYDWECPDCNGENTINYIYYNCKS